MKIEPLSSVKKRELEQPKLADAVVKVEKQKPIRKIVIVGIEENEDKIIAKKTKKSITPNIADSPMFLETVFNFSKANGNQAYKDKEFKDLSFEEKEILALLFKLDKKLNKDVCHYFGVNTIGEKVTDGKKLKNNQVVYNSITNNTVDNPPDNILSQNQNPNLFLTQNIPDDFSNNSISYSNSNNSNSNLSISSLKSNRGNINNLVFGEVRTQEERLSLAQLAGKASGVARRKKKTYADISNVLGKLKINSEDEVYKALQPYKEILEEDGVDLTMDTAIAFCNLEVSKSSPQMAQFVARMRGTLPAEKSINANINANMIVDDDRVAEIIGGMFSDEYEE